MVVCGERCPQNPAPAIEVNCQHLKCVKLSTPGSKTEILIQEDYSTQQQCAVKHNNFTRCKKLCYYMNENMNEHTDLQITWKDHHYMVYVKSM